MAKKPRAPGNFVASFPGQKSTGSPLPNPPLNLASGTPTVSTVPLSWSAPTGGALSYNLYRNTSLIASGVTLLTYTDSGLVANTAYTYYVTAVNALGEGLRSNTVNPMTLPPAPTNLTVTGTTATTASLSWGTGTVFLQENFTTYPAGNVALSDWTSNGYIDFENSGIASNLQVVPRASLPAGLLADPNFPASKTRALLVNLSANEIIESISWGNFPAGVRRLSQSKWIYMAGSQVGGQKFVRAGNFVGGVINANRLIDSIWTLGNLTGLTLIANSTQMFPSPDQGFGNVTSPWPPGLYHFESVATLSTGTNADGTVEFYVMGNLVARVTGYRFFNTVNDAANGWQVSDWGGWSSSGNDAPVTYPIPYYICAGRLADSWQGVWPMPSV